MSESSKQFQTPECIVTFGYKKTGYGGSMDTILISLDGNILPSRLLTSKSGNHGERQYKSNINSTVIMYDVYKSNLGNTYIKVKIINIDNKCNISTVKEWTLHSGKVIVTPIQNLPQNIQKVLLVNKDKLPLFDYVYF